MYALQIYIYIKVTVCMFIYTSTPLCTRTPTQTIPHQPPKFNSKQAGGLPRLAGAAVHARAAGLPDPRGECGLRPAHGGGPGACIIYRMVGWCMCLVLWCGWTDGWMDACCANFCVDGAGGRPPNHTSPLRHHTPINHPSLTPHTLPTKTPPHLK